MKRKTAVRIIAFCAAVSLVFGGLYIRERSRSNILRQELQNDYSRSLSELNSRLNSISLILEKTVYVTTAPQMSTFAAELYSEAQLAKTALSQLPSGEGSLDTVNRFLSQVGNYALSVSKSVITGNDMTDSQKNSLALLSSTAQTVSQAVTDIHINTDNALYWTKELENRLESTISDGSLADSLTQLEENITDYPTLIYDGPFSDHILTKKPLMLQNTHIFEKSYALKRANDFSGDDALKYDGDENGRIECYRFSSPDTTITVSKNGGFIVYMRKNRTVGTTSYSYDQALLKATAFMNKNGYTNMTDTYYFTDEGVCVINFAYLDGQTICYTDLVKVGVAMDTGEIMLFEASGYLFNHTDRAFSSPAYTSNQAAETISTSLTVEDTKMVLIPSDGGSEIRCFEFLCKGQNDEEILVYVNVMNLVGEQIFILLKTDGGTLVK